MCQALLYAIGWDQETKRVEISYFTEISDDVCKTYG